MSKQCWKLIGLVGIVVTLAGCSKAPVTSTTSPQVNVSTTPTPTPTPLPAPKEVWMTQFEQLNGTPYFYAPIYVAEQAQKSIVSQIKSGSYDSRKGDSYGTDIRNYMFIHRDNLSASKLLTNNSSRLIKMEQIGTAPPPDKSNPAPSRAKLIKTVKALWHVRVLADTNGDKTLNDLDLKQIAISDVSGANYTEIIKGIDQILFVYPKGLDRRLIIYTSGTKRFVADIDIPKRQATVKELPAIS
jgi:hypothetical protein